jgi:predicted Zn-dependent protease
MVTVVGIGEKLDFEGEIGHLISDNNLKEAKELVMIALDKVPNDIIRLCQYITILIKEKNYIEAERITLDLYNKYPDNFIIKGLLINIYTGLGKTVEAKKLVDEKTASETENDINDEIRAKQNIDILMHDKQYTVRAPCPPRSHPVRPASD